MRKLGLLAIALLATSCQTLRDPDAYTGRNVAAQIAKFHAAAARAAGDEVAAKKFEAEYEAIRATKL